jgi:ribosomal protein L37AE/L43A
MRHAARMGEILSVQCTCGYEADDLHVGCGLAGPDWCRDLAVCSHCCEIVTVRASKRRCPACRRQVVVVGVPALATGGTSDTVLLDTPCPRCGQEAMRVTESGIWD